MSIEILQGDCREVMAGLPERHYHCAVTSPPYWGLRDYNADGQIGLEDSPEAFIESMVEVFRSVRRVLRDDGVLWVNLGDTYADGRTGRDDVGRTELDGYPQKSAGPSKRRYPSGDWKSGDLCNMPNRVAEALRADGWYWRSTIIWHKRSPMPESISGWRWVPCRVKVGRELAPQGGLSSWDMGEHTHGPSSGEYRGQEKTIPKWAPCPGCDKCRSTGGLVLRRGKWRPTTSHEYIFLFAKSERYFCDGDAVQEMAQNPGDNREADVARAFSRRREAGADKRQIAIDGDNLVDRSTRNPRSVWTMSSEPLKEAHFAAYPTELPLKCLAASTSTAGCCAACGSPLAPMVVSERVPTRPANDPKAWKHASATEGDGKRSATSPNLDPYRHVAVTRITGYRPTCDCDAGTVPCRVLDPFNGAATTAIAARRLGLDYMGIELNPEYIELSHKRLRKEANRGCKLKPVAPAPGQKGLFD